MRRCFSCERTPAFRVWYRQDSSDFKDSCRAHVARLLGEFGMLCRGAETIKVITLGEGR